MLIILSGLGTVNSSYNATKNSYSENCGTYMTNPTEMSGTTDYETTEMTDDSTSETTGDKDSSNETDGDSRLMLFGGSIWWLLCMVIEITHLTHMVYF